MINDGSLEWLPTQLQALHCQQPTGLPTLLNLLTLSLTHKPLAWATKLSDLVPNLQQLKVSDIIWPDVATDMFADLAKLPALEHVEVSVHDYILDFKGCPGCRVSYCWASLCGPFSPCDPVPEGMAAHLQDLEIFSHKDPYPEDNVCDLSFLRRCSVLETVSISYQKTWVEVKGLQHVPQSLRKIEFTPGAYNDVTWHECPGWRVVVMIQKT